MLSVYVIAGSLFALVFGQKQSQQFIDLLNVMTATSSIFILVLSTLESGKNYALRAALMLRCAQAVSELHNELEFKLSAGLLEKNSFHGYMARYDQIIRDFSENHDNIDFYFFMAMPNNRKSFDLAGFGKLPTVIGYRLGNFLNIWGFYATLMIIPIIAFGIAIQ